MRDPNMPDDALGLGLSEPDLQSIKEDVGADDPAYRVLARKYRPQNFKELIGQDTMVQTLGNAIKRGRLAHAFLMTGVRGVGKTSTARLIAKALNCIGADGQGQATIDPCGVCEPCQAIAEGRHIDVIEMDAASHTGVDDVRDIIEAVRYASVSARYKIYIIDEVHMLSKNAFNALLKTLEEPPPHVKFLFATTEVNKVPITVLSRCQRFDLKRISISELADHFANIVKLENVKAEEEALALIARSAEGSVRDGLSILDQAIAHADWHNEDSQNDDVIVSAQQVRDMLGLSDRSAIRTLLGALLGGDVAQAMEIARNQYQLGIEPYAILSGLLREVHMITLAKLNILNDPAMASEAKAIMAEWGDTLSFPQLHRLWQLLLKGHEEIQKAAMPSEACDMALLRILHASSMPDPSELLKLMQEGGGAVASALTSSGASQSSGTGHASESDIQRSDIQQANIKQTDTQQNEPEPDQHQIADHNITDDEDVPWTVDKNLPDHAASDQSTKQSLQPNSNYNDAHNIPATFEAMIKIVGQINIMLDGELRDNVRLVKYAPPLLEYQFSGAPSPGFEQKLGDALHKATSARWTLTHMRDVTAAPSQYEQNQLDKEAKEQAMRDTPLVKAALAAFPDANFDKDSEQFKRSISA